ncbi:hypothetical protein [Gordonia rhizosphera]|uniref:Uncharacterized protein n=1 Tax=Gordonia rhizosphera NBRC 16068 TaxID=1108045 RepID=K6X0R9_9ACTN|nr:hypothetical protein [Gordonia rhizosphera]GAB92384.1 hypothetical protein GORHZ_172_00020 [Gordonia rhizosphera NBRC 16068]
MSKNRTNPSSHGYVPWRVILISSAMLIAIPAQASTAHAAPRTVTGDVVFQIMDYENFGANERCHHDFRLTPRSVEVNQKRIITVRATCGGEIRVEVRYALQQQAGGYIRVTEGSVKFYEGDSVNTNDLDGTSAFANIFLWPGQSAVRNIHVQNWAEGEPDDKADVRLTLRN